MPKITKTFRLDVETVQMLDTLVPFLSSDVGVKLDRTKVLEKLISDGYEKLLKDSERVKKNA